MLRVAVRFTITNALLYENVRAEVHTLHETYSNLTSVVSDFAGFGVQAHWCVICFQNNSSGRFTALR